MAAQILVAFVAFIFSLIALYNLIRCFWVFFKEDKGEPKQFERLFWYAFGYIAFSSWSSVLMWFV